MLLVLWCCFGCIAAIGEAERLIDGAIPAGAAAAKGAAVTAAAFAAAGMAVHACSGGSKYTSPECPLPGTAYAIS